MNSHFLTIARMSSLGFFTAWIGMLAGMIFSVITVNRGNKFKGTMLGIIGGIMLSIVCFDLLPESLEVGNLYTAIIGIILGLILATTLDGKLEFNHTSLPRSKSQNLFKGALLMAIGTGIHNIPGGIALGSLFYVSYIKGIQMALVLILHGIPEGMAIGIFLRESNSKMFLLILISVLTSIPMGIGSLLGGLISETSPYITSISLSFAGGMILYVVLRETLQESRNLWKGRLTTIGNILGIILGISFVSFFH